MRRASEFGIAALAFAVAACELGREPTTPDAVPDGDGWAYPPPRADLVPPVGSAETLEITTWNLENYPSDEMTASLVADLITSLDLDIVVVEEIASVASWEELLARLRDHDGVLSTHEYSPGNYQKIGVIYRAGLVEPGAPRLLFGDDGWAFPRPALSVPVTIDGVTVELVGVHLKAGVGYEDAERRRLAFEAIDTHLREQIDGGGEGEVILLGDYNEVVDEPDGRLVMARLLEAPDRYTVRTEPAATAGEVSYLGFGGKLIDHITTSAALDARWAGARLVVARLQDQVGSYTSLVSDHLPAILVAPR